MHRPRRPASLLIAIAILGCSGLLPDTSSDTPGETPRSQPHGSQLALSDSHSCGIDATGSVYCWGQNHRGELGNGNTTDSPVPSRVNLPGSASSIAVGNRFSCAALTSGSVFCWGDGSRGQLGTGDLADSHTPVRVSELPSVRKIAARQDSACAISQAWQVFCWGDNAVHLCDASQGLGNCETPLRQDLPVSSTDIALQNSTACAVGSDGPIRCWGSNSWGQRGAGEGSAPMRPVTGVPGSFVIPGASEIATGANHACLRAGGIVRCWGRNDRGQLGDNTTIDRDESVMASGPRDARELAAYGSRTCALSLTQDGLIRCWGRRIGQTTDALAPEEVTAISGARELAIGGDHICVIVDDGTARCFGNNSFGQLGDGTTIDRDDPVVVSGFRTAP